MGSAASHKDEDLQSGGSVGGGGGGGGEDPLLDAPELSVNETRQLLRHRDMHMSAQPGSGHKRLELSTWNHHTTHFIHSFEKARRMRESGKTTEYILLVCPVVRGRVASWLRTQCCACEGV